MYVDTDFARHIWTLTLMPRERRDLDADAVVQRPLAEVGAPRPGSDHRMHARADRVEADLLCTEEQQRADVAGFETIAGDDPATGVGERRVIEVVRQPKDVRRFEHPLQVLVEPEDRGPLAVA